MAFAVAPIQATELARKRTLFSYGRTIRILVYFLSDWALSDGLRQIWTLQLWKRRKRNLHRCQCAWGSYTSFTTMMLSQTLRRRTRAWIAPKTSKHLISRFVLVCLSLLSFFFCDVSAVAVIQTHLAFDGRKIRFLSMSCSIVNWYTGCVTSWRFWFACRAKIMLLLFQQNDKYVSNVHPQKYCIGAHHFFPQSRPRWRFFKFTYRRMQSLPREAGQTLPKRASGRQLGWQWWRCWPRHYTELGCICLFLRFRFQKGKTEKELVLQKRCRSTRHDLLRAIPGMGVFCEQHSLIPHCRLKVGNQVLFCEYLRWFILLPSSETVAFSASASRKYKTRKDRSTPNSGGTMNHLTILRPHGPLKTPWPNFHLHWAKEDR